MNEDVLNRTVVSVVDSLRVVPGFVIGHGPVAVTYSGGRWIVVLTSSVSFASLRREESSFTPLLVLFAKDPLRWALPR